MWKVRIYLETDSTFQGKKHRRCGYVLATKLRGEEKTEKGLGFSEETYHRAMLKTLAEAFFRMNKQAEICVYTEDPYITSGLSKLEEMAKGGWCNSNGKPMKNTAEWQEVYKQCHKNFQEPHKISTECGKHCYSMWIKERMKKNVDNECDRPMGSWMEPASGAGSKDNGVPGIHN